MAISYREALTQYSETPGDAAKKVATARLYRGQVMHTIATSAMHLGFALGDVSLRLGGGIEDGVGRGRHDLSLGDREVVERLYYEASSVSMRGHLDVYGEQDLQAMKLAAEPLLDRLDLGSVWVNAKILSALPDSV